MITAFHCFVKDMKTKGLVFFVFVFLSRESSLKISLVDQGPEFAFLKLWSENSTHKKHIQKKHKSQLLSFSSYNVM